MTHSTAERPTFTSIRVAITTGFVFVLMACWPTCLLAKPLKDNGWSINFAFFPESIHRRSTRPKAVGQVMLTANHSAFAVLLCPRFWVTSYAFDYSAAFLLTLRCRVW